MSSRPFLFPQTVANNNTMSADSFSTVTNINQISAIGYTLVWTISGGSPANGTFQVEVSNDYVPSNGTDLTGNPANAGTWVALSLTTAVTVTGTSGSAYIDVVGISAAWIRLHWVHSSGTSGTYVASVAGKVQ
jgi:hypothetical protein